MLSAVCSHHHLQEPSSVQCLSWASNCAAYYLVDIIMSRGEERREGQGRVRHWRRGKEWVGQEGGIGVLGKVETKGREIGNTREGDMLVGDTVV